MKSSAPESIRTAKAVKYKRGKFYNSLNKSSREKEKCSTQISLLSVNRAKINQAAEQTNMQRADSLFLSTRCLQFFSNFHSNWNDSRFELENQLSLQSKVHLILTLIQLTRMRNMTSRFSSLIRSGWSFILRGEGGFLSTAVAIVKADLNFLKYSTSGRIGGF